MSYASSTEIIETLRNDKRACELLGAFHTAAIKTNLSPEEYDKARDIVLMMAMSQNKEAMRIMSDSIYNEINNL